MLNRRWWVSTQVHLLRYGLGKAFRNIFKLRPIGWMVRMERGNSLLCRYHMQNQGLSMVHSRKSKQFKRIANFNELQKPNGNSLVVQWLGFGVFIAGVWVQYLIRELRFYEPSGAGEKKKVPNKGQFNMATVATVVCVCVCVCVCVRAHARALHRGKAGGTWRSSMIKVSFMPCKTFGLYLRWGCHWMTSSTGRIHTHTHTHIYVFEKKTFLNIPLYI